MTDTTESGLVWRSRTTQLLSPLFGGLIGSVYAAAASSGVTRGWYWPESEPTEAISTFVVFAIDLLAAAAGGLLGGFVASLFADCARSLAIAMTVLPFATLAWIEITSTRSVTSSVWYIIGGAILVIAISAAAGGALARGIRSAANEGRAPLGFWWPHWLYFPVVAYHVPIYAIATLTNVWIDLRLAVTFTFNPATWFWWKAWVYYMFLSWFAAVPTYILILGYARLLEQMRMSAGTTVRAKFNAFFMYFITVPTIAWFLTFAWRWLVSRLLS